MRLDHVAGELIDLSIAGAQVLAPIAVAPGDRREFILEDPKVTLRLRTIVAWAYPVGLLNPRAGSLNPSAEYRMGLRFEDTRKCWIDLRVFMVRHP